MRWLPLLLLVGCHSAAARERELAQCQAISESGDALERCLILNKDWEASAAQSAGLHWTAELRRRCIAEIDSLHLPTYQRDEAIRREC